MPGLGLQAAFAGQSLDDTLQALTRQEAATRLQNAELSIKQQEADTAKQRAQQDYAEHLLRMQQMQAQLDDRQKQLAYTRTMGGAQDTPLTPEGVKSLTDVGAQPREQATGVDWGGQGTAIPGMGVTTMPTVNKINLRPLNEKEQEQADMSSVTNWKDPATQIKWTSRFPALGPVFDAMNKPQPPTKLQSKEGMLNGVRTFANYDDTTGKYSRGGVDVTDTFVPSPPASQQTGPVNPDLTEKYLGLVKNPMSGVTLSQVPKPYHDLVVAQLNPTDLRKLSAQDITMVNTARTILPKFDTIETLANQINAMGLMGTVGGRIDSLASGESSAADIAGLTPEQRTVVGKFATEASLLKSAIQKAHVGLRGAGNVGLATAFEKILAPGNKDMPTYLGNLAGAREFMQGYSDMGNAPGEPAATPPPPATGAGKGGGPGPATGGGGNQQTTTPVRRTLTYNKQPVVQTKQPDGTWKDTAGNFYNEAGAIVKLAGGGG